MTDVRLTATNPVDSSVVPVACNAKGELLLEEPLSGDFVAKAGDNMTGALTIGPEDGPAVTTLAADGSAEFAGSVASDGITLEASTSSRNVSLSYEPLDATAPYGLIVENTQASGDSLLAIRGTSGGQTADYISIDRASEIRIQNQDNVPRITFDRFNGSAEFAGTVKTNKQLRVEQSAGVVNAGIFIQDANSALVVNKDGNDNITLYSSGSAEFVGDVVVGSRNRQWMLVESGGICHLVEQTRSIDTADLVSANESTTYPELRNIPQELDQLRSVVTALLTEVQRVEEKLRMAPESGWPVWDGSD